MSTALAIRPYDETEKIALAMVKSGFFQDSRDASQAIVKILAGQELGFGPFASMTGVYIIQGRPSIGANLMAASVKGSGRYDYRVSEMTDTACEIIFFERNPRQEIGRSRFTLDDARKAGTKNLDKFPRNMLFARAMSNGVRWFCPDVFSGAPVYTPEELGADVNQDGEVIESNWKPAPRQQPEPEPVKPADATGKPMSWDMMTLEEARAVKNSQGVSYGEIDRLQLAHMLRSIEKSLPDASAQNIERLEQKAAAIRIILNS